MQKWGAALTLRIFAGFLLVLGLVWICSTLDPVQLRPAAWIADAPNYYAAGVRLDAGHQLYRLMPGDQRLPSDPFASAGPFLYPPLLGVLWRPLALLPSDVVVIAFWLLCMGSLLSSVAWLLWRGGATIGIATIALAVPIVWTAWAANVGALQIPLLLFTWISLRRRCDVVAGIALGVAVSLKPTPAMLLLWLWTTRRWRALSTTVATVAFGLAIGAIGAGLASYADYVRVLREVASIPGTTGSLGHLLRVLGTPSGLLPLVPPAVAAAGAAATYLARDRPKVAWAIASCTIVLASPAFNLTNVSLLIAAVVPFDNRLEEHLAAMGGVLQVGMLQRTSGR